MASRYQRLVEKLLSSTNIKFGGQNPCDIQVNDERFFNRAIHQGLLGIGESYMDGWWDCKQLDQLTANLLRAQIRDEMLQSHTLFSLLLARLNFLQALFINHQTKKRAYQVAESHYDISNCLYEKMLDSNMNYTCGYWKNATDLESAQIAKLQLICEKLDLRSGMMVLDIGCGYGSFAKYAAINYGVKVKGISISSAQLALAKKMCEGLPVEFYLQDYREVTGSYDRIVSLGMFEHVGLKNYDQYFKICSKCLKDDGLFLLHTIGCNTSDVATNAWTNKYIFPNGMLPSIRQIGNAIEDIFVMEDWHNFGAYYDQTLMAWHENFNRYWPEIMPYFNERFKRMWNFYLLTSAGAFRARYLQLWQIVLSKKGVLGGYQSIR